MKNLIAIVAIIVASICILPSDVTAQITVAAAASGVMGPGRPTTTLLVFDDLPVGQNASYTFVGGSISTTGTVQNSTLTGYYVQPDHDVTPFLALSSPPTTAGSAQISLDAPADYFGLYWGSVDSYDQISFYKAGQPVASYMGTDIESITGVSEHDSRYIEFDFGNENYDQVVLSTPVYNFEIDNIAIGTALPIRCHPGENCLIVDLQSFGPSGPARALPPAGPQPRYAHSNPATPSPPTSFIGAVDPVLQRISESGIAYQSGLNFLGLGVGFSEMYSKKYTNCCGPPDTNAAVGTAQIVEAVNLSFAVFSKSTGALQAGPIGLSSLFNGVANNCETGSLSDPTVLFDKENSRWVITYLANSGSGENGSPPFLQCFAVSTTDDASGTYFRYATDLSDLGGTNTALNDYGKIGIWPDGYYMSFNEVDHLTGKLLGVSPCALPSSLMITGVSAQAICFLPLATENSLLPVDNDGSGASGPLAGEPAFFIGTLVSSSGFHLATFHADFEHPDQSTFSAPKFVPTAGFTQACPVGQPPVGGGICIPQPAAANGAELASLGDRLMYRAAYRNFASATPPHESIVVSHSVAVYPSTGVRWYEIRKPTSARPVIYQQGTFAPDNTSRWTPSIAIDKVGDIAVGYSLSSNSVYPSIRYTGRTPNMTRGTLGAEKTIANGVGVQITDSACINADQCYRWGDYSSMSIDPVDGCTFWYAQEYIAKSMNFSSTDWSTRLASFKFAGCQ